MSANTVSKQTEILSKLKALKFKQIIYPLIITLFIITVIILLVSSTKFLSKNINAIFSSDVSQDISSQLLKVDVAKFYFVADRLGISTEPAAAPQETAPPEPAIEEPSPTAPESTSTAEEIDKTSLKISVLNSTAVAGLAKSLKSDLEADGFLVQKIGDTSPLLQNTIIKIKESKSAYASLVKEIVSQKYILGEDQTLEEENSNDVIIIIGNQ